MALSPRDRLLRLLQGTERPSAHSASLTLPAGVLDIVVEGVGRVDLPVRPAQAKRLMSVARPAHFGRGEETLQDTSVRDTWELTPGQVSLGGDRWHARLDDALEELGAELGLRRGVRLRAELHSLLIYGKGQFFAPHQDSEKHDDMVATLVVSLPSAHTGGELVIDDRGAPRRYVGSRDELVLVAFYSDRRHEVLPVRTGHRVTMTFNLLIDTEAVLEASSPAEEVASCLKEHFATPLPRYYGGDPVTPTMLGVLLDHEYSRKGLTSGRLKGADAERVAVLRTAADVAGYECALALAEIQEIRNAEPSDSRYGYGEWDEDGDAEPDADDYEVGELIDGSVVLNWWTDRECPGEIELSIPDHEVCAVTPSNSLTPYSSEYEGYMGNYGNTIDRWYRRAALMIWPTENAFAARAEASADWGLRSIRVSLDAGDLERARTDAATLAALWHMASPTALPAALSIARDLRDASVAQALLASFALEMVSFVDAPALAALADEYDGQWWNTLRQRWDRELRFAGEQRREWVETALVPLCGALEDAGAASVVEWLADGTWRWLAGAIRRSIDQAHVGRREAQLARLGPALAATLTVADDGKGAEISADVRSLGDLALPLIIAALRSFPVPVPASAAVAALAGDARDRLTRLLARPERAADDWSIAWTSAGGQDADRLAEFLVAPDERTLLWPLAEPRRKQIHRAIDDADLPVRHTTRRTGRPYTLVLTKTDELFTREVEQRRRAAEDLAWIDDRFP